MKRPSHQHARPLWYLVAVSCVAVGGCAKEARSIDAGQAQTAPTSADDPRIARYQLNAYQVAQGSRYFTWYGCGGCHALGSNTAPDFGSGLWRHGGTFDQVYRFIDHGHGAGPSSYGRRIPVEQLWQITAYVRDVSQQPPEKRRRQDFDARGEPQGKTWSGAVR